MVDEALGFVDITCSELARLSEWTPAQFQNHVGLVLEEAALGTRRDLARALERCHQGRWLRADG